MKPGDTILVIPSIALTDLKLDGLVGWRGEIVAINGTFNKVLGCWIKFPTTYLGEREWYIPYNSISL